MAIHLFLFYDIIGVIIIFVGLEEDAGDTLELHLGTAQQTGEETAPSYRAMPRDRASTTVGEKDYAATRLEFKCQ